MVCLRNMCLDTLHKGDYDDDDDNLKFTGSGRKDAVFFLKTAPLTPYSIQSKAVKYLVQTKSRFTKVHNA